MTQEHTRERLWRAIDERGAELVDLTAELVRRPSTLEHEAAAQEFVTEQLRQAGVLAQNASSSLTRRADRCGAGRPGLAVRISTRHSAESPPVATPGGVARGPGAAAPG